MTVTEHMEAAQIVRERRARKAERERRQAERNRAAIHTCTGDATNQRCPHFDPLPTRGGTR